MNERIKELMKEAGTDSSGKWMSIDNADLFSKIIIEESVQWINDNVGMISTEAKDDLFNHFGFKKENTNA